MLCGNQSVVYTGRCVSPRLGGRSAGTRSSDTAQMEATDDGRQFQAASVSEGETSVLSQQMEVLKRVRLVYSTPQAMLASVFRAMPIESSFRLVTVYAGVNQHVEAVPWPHPNFEQAAELFAGARSFATLDLLQGF